MAVTYSITGFLSGGNESGSYGTITLDASYPTGGEAITARGVGLGIITSLDLEGDDGYVPHWDSTNDKIIMYYADYDAVADGALIQVADTTDLSAVILKFRAWGTG